jgi:hypothetical protein
VTAIDIFASAPDGSGLSALHKGTQGDNDSLFATTQIESAEFLAGDATDLYFIARSSDPGLALGRTNKRSGSTKGVATISDWPNSSAVVGFAVDDAIYALVDYMTAGTSSSMYGGASRVLRVDKGGSYSYLTATETGHWPNRRGLAVDEHAVYYSTCAAGGGPPCEIHRAWKDGSANTILATSQVRTPLALGASNVFFADKDGIHAVPKSGGAPALVAVAPNRAQGEVPHLVVCGSQIVWLSRDPGRTDETYTAFVANVTP